MVFSFSTCAMYAASAASAVMPFLPFHASHLAFPGKIFFADIFGKNCSLRHCNRR